MTNAIFLDTSAWFAALSPRDQWHAPAVEAYAAATHAGTAVVTTTLVVAEVHALLLRWREPAMGRRFLQAAFVTPSHTIIAPDTEVTRAAVERWIARYADQSFTLCDAVSFEVMRREGLSRALAFDRHFEIAGFTAIGA